MIITDGASANYQEYFTKLYDRGLPVSVLNFQCICISSIKVHFFIRKRPLQAMVAGFKLVAGFKQVDNG